MQILKKGLKVRVGTFQNGGRLIYLNDIIYRLSIYRLELRSIRIIVMMLSDIPLT
jgi:hypothetical protein